MEIKIIGGGLAGVEAAYQIAKRGYKAIIFEMRPHVPTPAHKTSMLSELVCSNSLKSNELKNAHGLLKEEMRILDSIIIKAADMNSIPGGKALVVDRERFSRYITDIIEKNPMIDVIRQEIKEIPSGPVIIATGPLTSSALTEKIIELTGRDNLFFYDAISPIIEGDSIDFNLAFFASRYKNESDDYLNCPLTVEEYDRFFSELIRAETVLPRDFEQDISYFEGCLPIEVMALRGKMTLLFGPMKPVGIIDKRTGKEPFAVVQLRREDAQGKMFNMVGFQTKLKYKEQERVFRLIPALKNAKFLRYGSIHRNTYIKSPELLNKSLQLKKNNQVFFAGQITGVEGYCESAAMGLLAGLSALCFVKGIRFIPPPPETCIGALLEYITTEKKEFQPMNINFGVLKDYNKRKKYKVIENALKSIKDWLEAIQL
ncbi:MAG TPA: methylenetetrahydrofolate--tRNA-(uracil(54)-C(5))-methyltransferase (FADH(2)-oxidizing) TrmFO [Syntrophorhabdaceae bacterium]|nr:methylenetetrahydrofolate--tRNA-(uracil(54)-C(5))-methyltransferase (FADH(2)-oxidizing) TrmFO [Syntrophorhabdaceae bacterium]HPU30022.1 methylenetetrahydrofolate--tRNA-(uracil(54)-C(5))-methyltransferase (FADH(2)-oxidizing) TrmFO [Syntrophorhabdaceae bacterium]